MQQESYVRAGVGAASGDPLEGRVLDGRYELGPRVARGGMAAVHEATDLRLRRTVAVKVMHAGLGDGSDGGFARRFVREARAAARLSHPGVVSVFDQGDDDGTLYLVMELVRGRTLRDVVVAEAPLTPQRALALLDPVLSALAAAHRAGLVHRDVKPENVLIADDGRVKVADFGLARAVSAESAQTATGGVLIGTVSYLAPELVVEGHYDARADVYAAGVVLFELLTGCKPHEGESPIQVAYRHVHHDVPPPSSLVPGIPAFVDALVARATARDAGLRPADADVMLHQLHQVGRALADGVDHDPDLVADLALPAVRTDEGLLPDADLADAWTDDDPPPVVWDDDEVPDLFEFTDDDGEHTRSLRAGRRGRPGEPRHPDDVGYGPPSGRGPRLLVLALLIVLTIGAGAYWFGWGRYTDTPPMIGDAKAQAADDLAEAGLEVEWATEVYSETVPAGDVVSTDPVPGARVLDGGTVTVVVSLGQERYDVPRLRGLTEDAAQDALLELNLRPDAGTEQYSETVPEGEIISSDPVAGTALRRDTEVALVVSLGPRPIDVGGWVGSSVGEAKAALADRGLVAEVTREYDDDVPQGDVISQTPDGGTLFSGDTVELVVSRGPEFVTVPSVKLLPEDAAVKRLEDLGLDVEVETTRLHLGFAARTDPPVGEQVRVGSQITLYVV